MSNEMFPVGSLKPMRTRAERVAYLDGMARALRDAEKLLLALPGDISLELADVIHKLHASGFWAEQEAVREHNYRRRKVGGGRRTAPVKREPVGDLAFYERAADRYMMGK